MNRAEYLVVLHLKEGQPAPTIDAVGAALEVGTDDPPEELGFDAVTQIVVQEPTESEIVKALEESRERLVRGLNARHARVEHLSIALRQIAGSGLTDDGAEQARKIADAALEGSDERRFMVQWENAARAEFCTLDDMVSANEEGDPLLCVWARRAEVGESYLTGGGAAPAVTTWRIA